MNKQLLRLKKRTDNTVLQVAECDASNNLYVNVADGSIDVDKISEVDKAVLYGTDKAGIERPVLINDEGQLDTSRMQMGDVVYNGYVTWPTSAPQYTVLYYDIPEPVDEIYDVYNVYITNTLPNILTLSVRNNNTNLGGVSNHHEIYTAKVPAAPYITFPSTAWSSCFTSIGGILTDESNDLNDAGANDVPFAFAAADDAIYFGANTQFKIMQLNIGTAGVYNATFVWEYWNGSTWTTLPDVVGIGGIVSTPFKTSGITAYKWNTPNNWVEYDIPSDPTAQYWIRIRCTSFTSRATTPLITNGQYVLSKDIVAHFYSIEHMFNGDSSRIVLSNDTALTVPYDTVTFITVKKY